MNESKNDHARMKLKSVFKAMFLFILPLFFYVIPSEAFQLTLGHSWTNGYLQYDLSWEEIEATSTDTVVLYYIYEEFGLDGMETTYYWLNNTANSDNYYGRTFETNISIAPGDGSRCFVVVSSEVLVNPDGMAGTGYYSNHACHSFIHYLTGEGIVRADGDGTQRGIDQKWDFTYSMDDDAYVTARIYPPGTTFQTDLNNFIITAGSDPIKTLVEYTPRSGEMVSHSITMQETWDSRDSSGSIVGNGIYYLLLQATMDSGQFNGVLPQERGGYSLYTETLLRSGVRYDIPVDILRILNLQATGITLTNSRSQISYDITGDALVRLVVAQPGSGFMVDANGDIQPTPQGTMVADESLIVSSFTFQRKAGSNTEVWDGFHSTGTAMPSGVYAVGISATDEYGNHAIDASGNDFPIFTTISLERTVGSDVGDDDSSTNDTTAPTVTSMFPASGSTVSSAVSTITIVMTDTGGGRGVNTSGCTILVTGPNGSTLTPDNRTNDDATGTVTLTYNTALETNGTYTVSVTPIDYDNNSPSSAETFTFGIVIGLAATDFETTYSMYPNPVKAPQNATITYQVSVNSVVSIEIFNLLGERVQTFNRNDTASAGTQTQVWDLKNASGKRVGSGVYMVRITATGGGNTVESIKKLVVIQ